MAIKRFVKCCDCGEMVPSRNAWGICIDVLSYTSCHDDTNMFSVCKNCADKLKKHLERSDEDNNGIAEEEKDES